MTLLSLLPERLVQRGAGEVATATALAGAEFVCLYFSASWCPPCRAFTPELSEWVTSHAAAHKAIFVFASNDKSAKEAAEYWGEHQSLPFMIRFEDGKAVSRLGSLFKVEGIPSLVVLDAATGRVVNANARAALSTEPANFPWRTPSVAELLLRAPAVAPPGGGAPLPTQAFLDGLDRLALYFSAHWCGPCRQFTPAAAAWYKSLKATDNPDAARFDALFISSDRDASSFAEYAAEMPWKALPFEHREVKDALSRRFGVRGIPTMILLKREPVSEGGGWAVEHADLRSLIVSEPERFPWPPVPLPTIDAAVASINETPTVVVFTDKMTDAAAEAALVAAARAAASLPRFFPDGAPHPRLRFAHAGEAHDATEQVRHFAGFGKDRDGPAAARVVLIDVEAQGKAELPPAPGGELPTADALAAFADAALAGAVQLVPFGKGAA